MIEFLGLSFDRFYEFERVKLDPKLINQLPKLIN